MSADGSGNHIDQPFNVVWSIQPSNAHRTEFSASLQYVQRSEFLRRKEEVCKKRDTRCNVRNENTSGFNAAMMQIDSLSEFRFEFDLTAAGLELIRSLGKHEKDDDAHWIPYVVYNTCIKAALKKATISD